jgi:hypothetical protein
MRFESLFLLQSVVASNKLSSSLSSPVLLASNELISKSNSTNMINNIINSISIEKQVILIILMAILVPILSHKVGKYVVNENKNILTRFLFISSYILNVIIVSIPGRFDSQTQRVDKDGKPLVPWTTVFAPAPWAFAIWGIIYLGEMIVSLYSLFIGSPINLFQQILPYWMAGNLFQCLWCLIFRIKFINYMFIPFLLLGLSAGSYIGAHNIVTKFINDTPILYGSSCVFDYNCIRTFTDFFTKKYFRNKILALFIRLPIALHCAWLLAASLLNFNGYIALSKRFTLKSQVNISLLSSVAASIVGSSLSYLTGDPFIAFTVAWALAAISAQSKNINQNKNRIIDITPKSKELLVNLNNYLSKSLIVLGILSALFHQQ